MNQDYDILVMNQDKNNIKILNKLPLFESNKNYNNFILFLYIESLNKIDTKIIKKINKIKLNPKNKIILFSNIQKYDLNLFSCSLKLKVNLIVDIKKNNINNILDPLGNIYQKNNEKILFKMIKNLINFKRMNSISVGENNYNNNCNKDFLKIIMNINNLNHYNIHSEEQNRFLGNCSYRDINNENIFWISERNLDKRNINSDNFVPVKLMESNVIEFYGEKKPSVDAPIQKELFKILPNINYMIHLHLYINEINFNKTLNNVPCGSIEEIEEILFLIKDKTLNEYLINLKGHGCLIMSKNIPDLNKIIFINKPFPELI